MDLNYCIHELETNARVVEKMIQGFASEQVRWKPSDLEWSALEVVCHLRDEEREDFPYRICHLLSGSTEKWPPILPAKWVSERSYNSDNLQQALADYLAVRAQNVDWLKSLRVVDWDARYTFEPLVGLSAGDLMSAWTVHDLLHIRQLNELKYHFGERHPFEGRMIIYAGEW